MAEDDALSASATLAPDRAPWSVMFSWSVFLEEPGCGRFRNVRSGAGTAEENVVGEVEVGTAAGDGWTTFLLRGIVGRLASCASAASADDSGAKLLVRACLGTGLDDEPDLRAVF